MMTTIGGIRRFGSSDSIDLRDAVERFWLFSSPGPLRVKAELIVQIELALMLSK